MPLPSSVHPAISAIVRRALSFAADHRYPTAADLREAIERAMVATQCSTSSSEVAAFAAAHLADRIEKRRASIDAALAAAAAREQLHPPEERRPSSVLPGFQTGSPPWPPPSSGMLPSPLPASAKTRADAPAAKPPTLETLARLTPRLSEPPPNASSYATLGSAALDASVQIGRSRKGIYVLAAALLLAAGGAAAFSFNALRPPAAPAVSGPPPATSAMPVKPANSQSEASPADSASSSRWGSLTPTIAASSLPRAVPPAPPPQAPRRPVWSAGPKPRRPESPDSPPETGPESPAPAAASAPPAPPTPPPPTPPTPAPAKTIDDGF